MARHIEASIHLARQSLKVGWFALVHEIGSGLARRRVAAVQRAGDTRTDPSEAQQSDTSEPAPKRSTGPSRGMIFEALRDLLASDAALVRDGIVPPLSDAPVSISENVLRLRDMFADIPKAGERSAAGARHEVRDDVDTEGFPDYYTQNFHYQTGGYLTSDSARLYDLQVETLFSGTAGAMRRQAIRPIHEAVVGRTQRKLALLDVACGTGRAMGQLSHAFPAMRQVGIDLSEAYLDEARTYLRDRRNVEFLAANAETLPQGDETFDFVTCSFLFHELPEAVRRTVIAEMARVLKPGGLMVFIDSMQLGDRPEFDGMLAAFPERFHEPYYRNYIEDDLDAAFRDAGLASQSTWTAFLSKVMVRRKSC